MKQTTLSLTFPSVLFKFFSSKGKTAMFSCFQTSGIFSKWMRLRILTLLPTNPWKWRRKEGVSVLLWTVRQTRNRELGHRDEKVECEVKKALCPVRRGLILFSFSVRWKIPQWKCKRSYQVISSLINFNDRYWSSFGKVCPLCQLPLNLLWSPSLVSSRVHLNDCQV